MMRTVRQIHADSIAPTPWRNRGGQTRELLTRPEADPWQLRISLADIDADGPFSAFPETQRWFGVVEGAGVVLSFADRHSTVTPESPPLCFDGAEAPHCTLLNGPTRDLNLMLRRGSAQMVEVQPNHVWHEGFGERGLFTLCEGTLHAQGHATLQVAARTLLWFLPSGPCRFDPRVPGRAGWWLAWSADAIRQE